MFVTALGITMLLFVAAMFGLSFWVRDRVDSAEDFLVAGRRLPLSLAWPTLLATWFGAGSLLTATDEVHANGLRMAALDPWGTGACLLLAGLWFARPLWRMKLLTLPEFYGRRFGARAEILASLLMIPGYYGWIAAQLVAMAGVLNLFFGLDIAAGIVLVAAVGGGYALIGGMWSVTLTDAVQIAVVLVGLVILGGAAAAALWQGSLDATWGGLRAATPTGALTLLPTENAAALTGWFGVLAVGALGNLPGQDLMQRVFAARCANTAQRACYVAGGLYLLMGLIPVGLGVAAHALLPNVHVAVLPALAQALLHPALSVVMVVAVLSAVLSTVDSAILSPSGIMAQNLLARLPQRRWSGIQLNRFSVVVTTLISVAVAFLGESAYSLLESAYAVSLVSLLVPLAVGLYSERGSERAALLCMGVGTAAWVAHLAAGWDTFGGPWLAQSVAPLPMALTCAGLGLVVYWVESVAVPSSALDSAAPDPTVG